MNIKTGDNLTIGEFAKLARTTKRTVTYYSEIGVLEPVFIDPKTKYRYFDASQIIDLQFIMLLRRINFSIEDIKKLQKSPLNITDLFQLKKSYIEKEIINLQSALQNIDVYNNNLNETGTLVKPVIKFIESYSLLYIEKEGPYNKIGLFFDEFKTLFSSLPKDTIFLVYFNEFGYHPKKAKLKIGLINNSKIKINDKGKSIIKEQYIPKFKALTYRYDGLLDLLSFIWKEMNVYQNKKSIPLNFDLGGSFEVYIPNNKAKNKEKLTAEIQTPII